jgi:hypothetical protein
MKFESRIFLASAAFHAVVATIYWKWSHEEAGTAMLAMGGVAWILLWLYLALQSRRIRRHGPGGLARPEDRNDATIAEAAGPVARFPGPSVWPLAIGWGATVLGLGLVFGPWFALIGLALMVASAAGYAAESQRH